MLLVVLLLMMFPTLPLAAEDEYEYEQKDQAAELKKSIQRLERDKHKVGLAIDTTKTLIDRSRQRPMVTRLHASLSAISRRTPPVPGIAWTISRFPTACSVFALPMPTRQQINLRASSPY